MIHRITDHVYMVDLETGGYKGGIASYVIVGEEGMAVIDTGPKCSVDNLIKDLSIIGDLKDVKYVIATHIHLDHFGGAATSLKSLENANILVHPRGRKHLINPEKLWMATKKAIGDIAEFYGRPDNAPEDRVLEVKDNEEIALGDVSIRVIYTPGHAPHHVSYYVTPDSVLITGDSVGIYHAGMLHPVSLYPFDMESALRSLDKMIEVKPKYVVFSHFGMDTSGEKILMRGKEKLIKWYEMIKDLILSGNGFEDIYRRILESDAELRKIVENREKIPYFKGSGKRCVFGMYMAIKEKLDTTLNA
ncbi:MAG: MBL fold metallo-hydrolase [Euryarchaeota archaeon]|nr:MBL fold metallo-hydrolase [Euryarchaeota archaeon]